MNKSIPLQLSMFFMCAVLFLVWVRAEHGKIRDEAPSFHSWSNEVSPHFEKIIAGNMPGLIADFRVMDVFSVYYDAQKSGNQNEMRFINAYLKRAQNLDPKFFDVYRLASSILVYDAKMPREGIELLQQGIIQRPEAWEFPFFAGFIAHDQLGDDKLAFELMSQVATREGTPLLVITLASRFLASATSEEDAIIFLRGLLQLVPKENQAGIRKRLKELEQKREENLVQ